MVRTFKIPQTGPAAVEWRVSDAPVDYPLAVGAMEKRVAAIRAGDAPEMVWLVEHPPLYTAGSSANPNDLIDPDRLPVHQTGRGGQYTYHGPGQRVAYVMLDLTRRGRDVRRFVGNLEDWIIRTLAGLGVQGERRDGRVGIWVGQDHGQEAKIASIGIRVRHWISFHGLSINLDPDLDHFAGIVPCGISDHGVTSLACLGVRVTMPTLDRALHAAFEDTFCETAGRG